MEPTRAGRRKRYGEIGGWGVREDASIRRARLAGVAVVVVMTTIAAPWPSVGPSAGTPAAPPPAAL